MANAPPLPHPDAVAAVNSANVHAQLEVAMLARCHPPFTDIEYMNLLVYQLPGTVAMANANSLFALFRVLDRICLGKANGDAAWYNLQRNSYV